MTKRILVNEDKETHHSSACSFKKRTMWDFPGLSSKHSIATSSFFRRKAPLELRAAKLPAFFCG